MLVGFLSKIIWQHYSSSSGDKLNKATYSKARAACKCLIFWEFDFVSVLSGRKQTGWDQNGNKGVVVCQREACEWQKGG